MGPTLTVKTGDRYPTYWTTPIDLTGSTVRLIARRGANAAITLPSTIVEPTLGRVEHILDGTLTVGTYVVELEITRGEQVITAPTDTYEGLHVIADISGTAVMPVMDICYPPGTDWGCALSQQEIDSLDPDVKVRSEALAWSTLSALLGYRLSLCPVVLRPCAAGCSPTTWQEAPVVAGSQVGIPRSGVFGPYISGGHWYNSCGCESRTFCSCSSICEIVLPVPVGGIASISIDGVVLDPSTYRVDNANRLVRMGGECWPACQDMEAASDAVGSFTVSFYPHLAPNALLRYAAGILANEFYRACTGGQCRLPQGVTSISRSGVVMEIPSGLFPNGGTGIREVDAIIRIYNPFGLKTPPRVMSPDSGVARVQTWAH